MSDYYVDLDGNISKKKKKKNDYSVSSSGKVTKNKVKEDDIAPVKKTSAKEETKEERTWFQKGAFDDGYQFGDVTKVILGTGADVATNLGSGIIGIGEKAIDAAMTLGTAMNQSSMMQAAQSEMMLNAISGKKTDAGAVLSRYQAAQDEAEKATADFVAKDLYDEEKIAKTIISDPVKKYTGIDSEQDSVLGEKSDSLVQSGGQLLAQLGVNYFVPGSGMALMATTSFGSEAENAFNNDATFDEAILSSSISAGAEVLTERLGGISFGGKTLTDKLAEPLARKMTSKLAKALVYTGKIAADATAEGVEEIVSGYASAIGQQMTYMEDKEIEELFSKEDMLESFIGGFVLGGVGGAVDVAKSTSKGIDPITGLTKNEQAVANKVYEDTVAEKEKNGKLTIREKNKIYDDVVKQMERGYISTDTIESVLGGESYEGYKSLSEQETAIKDEIEALENTPESQFTVKQRERLTELREQLKGIDTKTAKSNLFSEVDKLTANDAKLRESYNEKARRGQAFEADLTKYDAKQQETIKKAVESGILNNTNRTHEFVELVAKISADKGVPFDFTNNQKLKESGFAIDGKQVNGYVTKDGVTLNVNSAKSLDTVVGHEIAHVLEGTDLYTELQTAIVEYAKSKNDYQGRYDTLAKLYENIEGANIDSELTAELVGDYLFTDTDFIHNLSTNHRNVFEKIYDEIKYLYKVATAGSKEARELERVKKLFEDAYRNSGKAQVDGTKYSLEQVDGTNYVKAEKNIFVKEDGTVASEREVFNSLEGKTIPLSDGDVKVVKRLPGKDMYNELFKRYPRVTGGVENVKQLNSDVNYNAKELLSNSEAVKLNEPDEGKRHKAQGIVGFDTRIVKFYDGSKAYDIEFSIATLQSGEKVAYAKKFFGYDADLTKKIQDVEARSNQSPLNQQPVSDAKLPQDAKNVKAQFSLSENGIDNAQNLTYNGTRGESYARTDEFRNLQAESQRMSDEDAELYRSGSKQLDDEVRGRLSRAFGLELRSADSKRISSVRTLLNPKTNNNVNIVEGVDGSLFHDVFEISRKYLRNGELVDLHTVETTEDGIGYNDCYNYLSEDGLSGFSITPDGDLISVFNLNTERGFLKTIAPIVKEKAKTLDCYASPNQNLMVMYEKIFGFKTASLMDYNMEYDHDNIAENHSMPKVAFMVNTDSDVSLRAFAETEYDEAVEYRNSFMDQAADNEAASFMPKNDINLSLSAEGDIAPVGNFMGKDIALPAGEAVAENGQKTDFRKAAEAKVAEEETLKDMGITTAKDKLLNQLENGGLAQGADAFGRKYWIQKKSDGTYVAIVEGEGSGGAVANELNKECDSFDEAYTSVWEYFYENDPDTYSSAIHDYVGDYNQTHGVSNAVAEPAPADISPVAEAKVEDYAPGESLEEQLAKADESVESLDIETEALFRDYAEQKISDAEFEAKWRDIDKRLTQARQEQERLSAEMTDINNRKYESLDDSDIPPEAEAPYYGDEESIAPVDPFAERDMHEVGKRNVKAYMYENPEVKPFFQDAARGMLHDLHNGTKGERLYNDQLHYESGGESGWMGTSRRTTGDIADLLDQWGYTYAQIEAGLNAIIEDNGKENNAASKRIEFMLDNRLRNGYKDVDGRPIPKDDGYINLLKEKAIDEHRKEGFDSFMENADKYAPPEEDIAPLKIEPAIEGEQNVLNEFEQTEQEPERLTRAKLHSQIIDRIKSVFTGKGIDFDKVLDDAHRMNALSINDNTPQRVNDKTFGYEAGEALNDLTFNKVALNESEGVKWLNKQVDTIRNLSKKYKIKPLSKESAAAQMYAEGFWVNEKDEIIAYGDAELAKDFPDVQVQNRIKALASDPTIREFYDNTLSAINESRKRNAYPEIPRLENYYLHFRAMDDTFSKLGIPFNPNDIKAKDLPTDINGTTIDRKPGQPFFTSAMHREGKRTSFDLLGGLERYANSAKNQIYHIDDIQTARALWGYIADRYGQAHGLENLDDIEFEAQAEHIQKVYDGHLSNYARFLVEYANNLAGKTALIDRGVEGLIGRRALQFINTVNSQTSRNQVGYSISSPLTNFIPSMEAIARTSKRDSIKAFAQTVSNVFHKDGFVESDPTLIRRKGADKFSKTLWEKMSDPGFMLMSAVDNVTSEFIVRTKYNELTRKGMDSKQAHIKAGEWASRVMGDRSLGQMPLLYNSKFMGLFTKYQLEVRNQLDSQFYDNPQEVKASTKDIENQTVRNAKTAAKIASKTLQIAVLNHVFGTAFEKIAGYNPAFDIISTIATLFGWDDDEDDEDTFGDNANQAFKELLGDLPYTSLITDGGRIPAGSALPIKQLVTGIDKYGNEKSRLETIMEAAPYYLLPGGYSQIKKTAQGLGMFSEDHPVYGSYTDSGNLRFPVEKTFGNVLQAGLFGQYASENARDYFDNERSPLKEKQIQEYIDLDIPIKDYWEYREGLSDIAPLPGKTSVTLNQKGDYIGGLDLPVSKKNILINNLAPDRKTPIDMTTYEDYKNFEEFDFAQRYPEKYAVLKDQGISVEDYKANLEETAFLYTDDYSWAADNPDKYAFSKVISDDVRVYKQYTSELSGITADKDENGKSISGSKKAKVFAYIDSLPLDYGQKCILFKSQYKADDSMNMDIVEYLGSRENISYEEMVTILTELDFTVNGNNVYWD